jgi:hypothetical protein
LKEEELYKISDGRPGRLLLLLLLLLLFQLVRVPILFFKDLIGKLIGL